MFPAIPNQTDVICRMLPLVGGFRFLCNRGKGDTDYPSAGHGVKLPDKTVNNNLKTVITLPY